MPNTAYRAPESVAERRERAQRLGGHIADPAHGYRLHVTLNSNTSTIVEGPGFCKRNRPDDMRDALYKVWCGLNSKTHRNKGLNTLPKSAWWHGWAFLEGHNAYEAKGVTLHWHIIMGPGRDLSPEKYADLMTPANHIDPSAPPLCVSHIRDLWGKRYPKGTVAWRMIDYHDPTDLPMAVGYAMKELLKPGPYQGDALDAYQLLPFR
ncbi:hypothetical protein [Sulfitobacter sp. 1A16808]|uniref:hypothetical protein n=1 Tax=Sulfitobacter sp. 1A16808 TaxID=3368572 RepID=UPI003746939B